MRPHPRSAHQAQRLSQRNQATNIALIYLFNFPVEIIHGQSLGAALLVNTPFPTLRQSRLKTCWPRRHGKKLKARFAAVRVRVADGKARPRLPGEEVWLVGEHRTS